jgi:hypothetical protein
VPGRDKSKTASVQPKQGTRLIMLKLICSVVIFIAASITVVAAQSGPVGRACKAELASLCPGKPHDGSARICLEENYDKVSAGCKKALDTTGGGRGRRLGRGG